MTSTTVRQFGWSLFLLPLGVAGPAAVARAGVFESETYGYRIEVPSGWVRIPQDVLESAMGMVLKAGGPSSQIHFEAAFQANPGPPWMATPYLMMAVSPYATPEPPPERQLEAIVRNLTGTAVETVKDQALNESVAGLVSVSDQPKAVYDAQKHRFMWNLNMDVAFSGKLQGRAIGLFGKESLVMLNYYDWQKDWNKNAGLIESIGESFRFDRAHAYPPPFWKSSGFVRGLIATMLVVLVSAGIVIYRQVRERSRADVV